MSRARGHSLERRFWLALVGLSACLGCSSATNSTGGNSGTGTGGSAGGASNQAGGGTNSSGAGPGAAGNNAAGGPDAGASSGGAPAGTGGVQTGVGGSADGAGSGAIGNGGKDRACETVECFVANTCLDQCGGSEVYAGCCPCEPPSVNKLTCPGTN